MAEPKSSAELVAASLDALDRYEAEGAPGGDETRPPAPGDVFVLEATRDFEVEWVIVAHDPADLDRFLAVPADGNFLVGSADVELADDSPMGALRLRCRFATWIDVKLLNPEHRVGVVAKGDVAEVRHRWFDGEVTGSALAREVDDDPEYRDWVEEVLRPARQELIAAVESEKPPRRMVASAVVRPVRKWPRLYEVAASIFLMAAGGWAGLQLWRQNAQIETLEGEGEAALEKHRLEIERLEGERARLETEYQQELEKVGEEHAEAAQGLREEIAELDLRLKELARASSVVNPVIAFFRPPEETRRGKVEVTLRPENSYMVLFLELREPSPAPRYQLKLRLKGVEAPIWTNDRLIVQEPGEIRIGLPAEMLTPGEYVLELLALGGDTTDRVAEYDMVVFASSDALEKRVPNSSR